MPQKAPKPRCHECLGKLKNTHTEHKIRWVDGSFYRVCDNCYHKYADAVAQLYSWT